jgi:hypothetical protein
MPMIKVIYSLCALLLSSAMYLFSNGSSEMNCSNEFSGKVKQIETTAGVQLVVEGDNKIIYHPRIEENGVVLAAGTRVKVCYTSIKKINPGEELVLINAVACLP